MGQGSERLFGVAQSLRVNAVAVVDAFAATETFGSDAVWRGPNAERYRAEWRSVRDLLEQVAIELRAAARAVEDDATRAQWCEAAGDADGFLGIFVRSVCGQNR